MQVRNCCIMLIFVSILVHGMKLIKSWYSCWQGFLRHFYARIYYFWTNHLILVWFMGCFHSKNIRQIPGYEEPTVLAAETPCEYPVWKFNLLSFWSFFMWFLDDNILLLLSFSRLLRISFHSCKKIHVTKYHIST